MNAFNWQPDWYTSHGRWTLTSCRLVLFSNCRHLERTCLLQMSMQKIRACCPQKGYAKGYGWTCFCSHSWSDCLNVATLTLLLGFLCLFRRALWNATSLCCFSCAELWIQPCPQLSCQPALTVRTCLFPSAKKLFTRSRKQQETFTWSIALDFQLISYAKGERLWSLL